jgi:oxepin-CoA hydrolase/3-oxo-5,6-dehydrosuberyl-CoA semialdehyde dehydrogenase
LYFLLKRKFNLSNNIETSIVKWLVEMLDETNEVTGVATILTMVRKKMQ